MTDSQPTNPLGRLLHLPGRRLHLPGRTSLLIGLGLLLVVIALFAPKSCGGADIGDEQAIATARAALAAESGAFVPTKTEAKLLRQGFPAQLLWVVVFTVADPDGDREDFLHKADIWVHANTGEVRQVIVHKRDE